MRAVSRKSRTTSLISPTRQQKQCWRTCSHSAWNSPIERSAPSCREHNFDGWRKKTSWSTSAIWIKNKNAWRKWPSIERHSKSHLGCRRDVKQQSVQQKTDYGMGGQIWRQKNMASVKNVLQKSLWSNVKIKYCYARLPWIQKRIQRWWNIWYGEQRTKWQPQQIRRYG